MQLTNIQAQTVLAVHDTLWNAVYDRDSDIHILNYNDQKYTIQIPPHRGYASVILPNSNGTKFLWITQNLNKSTYGTLDIERNAKLGNNHRITWIVDTTNGGFVYRTYISTTRDSTGNLLEGIIQIYDSLGQETVWATNKALQSRKAEF